MKKPTSIVLQDHEEFEAGWNTAVQYVGEDDYFVEVRHDLPNELPFGLTRKEVRQLRNFLNKCLER